MRAYTVHIKDDRNDTAVLIKDGFSWAAFLFTAFWALWHRMWVAGAVLFILFSVTGVALAHFGFSTALSFVVHGVMSLIVGLGANELRRLSLKRRGFRESGQVLAANAGEAEIKMLGEGGAWL